MAFLLALTCGAPFSQGGGGPQNVLVVVNDNSIESLEIGARYAELRGVPQRNICHVSFDPSVHRTTPETFQTSVVDRVNAHIAAQGLSNQIDYVVLCKEFPYAVRWDGDNNRQNSASSVLFYGAKNYTWTGFCEVHGGTTSRYFNAERAFDHDLNYAATSGYITAIITATNLPQVRSLVDRNVLADGLTPTGTIFLLKSPDPFRNVRYLRFDNFDFFARFRTNFPSYNIAERDSLWVDNTNVLGYLHGAANPVWINNNSYLPGAMADHLTSCGGFLFDASGCGQKSILEWIGAGISMSHGTVVEPCAFNEKFPDPLNYYYQARGFNNGESYMMAIRNPYQGVLVGDPLTAPFARPPAVSILAPTPGNTVSGLLNIVVAAATGSADAVVSSAELYVDDLWRATITNISPEPGNRLVADVLGSSYVYTVTGGDDFYRAVTGLAAVVNGSSTDVFAEARGDRLQLRYRAFGNEGSGINYAISTATGTAARLTIFGESLTTNLLESTYHAIELINLSGTANTGDKVDCTITLTNGLSVTNRIVATNNETASQVMTRLMELVNGNTSLLGTNGVHLTNHVPQGTYSEATLVSRSTGPRMQRLYVDYAVTRQIPISGLETWVSFSDNFNDNAEVLTARGVAMFRRGVAPLVVTGQLDTATLPNGWHELMVVVRDGAATEVQGRAAVSVLVSNSGLSASLTGVTNAQEVYHGTNLLLQAGANGAVGAVTHVVFRAEGKTVCAGASTNCSVSLAEFGPGPLDLQATVWDSTGQAAVSSGLMVRVLLDPYADTDGDGLGDLWEQEFFKSVFAKNGSADSDGDGFTDAQEFVTDTVPTNGQAYFTIDTSLLAANSVAVQFSSSTARLYAAEQTLEGTNFTSWVPASTGRFFGVGGPDQWVDDPLALSKTARQYRIQVSLP